MTRPSLFALRRCAGIATRLRAAIGSWDLSDMDPDTAEGVSTARMHLADLARDLRDAADQVAAVMERAIDTSLCRAEEARDEQDHNRPEREEA